MEARVETTGINLLADFKGVNWRPPSSTRDSGATMAREPGESLPDKGFQGHR
jgi:hypothetical protein